MAAIVLSLAGAAASSGAYLKSSAPVGPASPWSLSERLAALRIDRGLPSAVRKQASLSLRGDHAVLKVREATGPVLLKCPLRAGLDVGDAYLSYATSGTPPGCETQAVDEVGDVLVYEVSGRVAHPGVEADAPAAAVLQPGRLDSCPAGGANCAVSKAASALLYCGVLRTCAEGACFQGQTADIKPDDVAASLYYAQALAQAKAPASVAPAACGAVPMSVHLSTLVSEAVTVTSAARFLEAQPWNAAGLAAPGSAETANDLRAFFERTPRGICLFIHGIDVDRPREAEMAAQSLAFPVFAPFDPRATGRASPLLRALQRAAFDEDAMASLFSRCDLASDHACKQKRERMAAQLRVSVPPCHPGKLGRGAEGEGIALQADGPLPAALARIGAGKEALLRAAARHLRLPRAVERARTEGPGGTTRQRRRRGRIRIARGALRPARRQHALRAAALQRARLDERRPDARAAARSARVGRRGREPRSLRSARAVALRARPAQR
ncbi:MAG: hypothetical protein E6J62_05095 [Deltaproteobacteria bacterium]|nr:MAG: hypothetical protein E6J62_05095 [Deltaproteobacteria bacterium]